MKIFDTTLRDGAQTPGVGWNLDERLQIAGKIADTGVDIMEIGFGANKTEFEWMKEIAREIGGRVEVCSLSRLLISDIDFAYAAIEPAKNKRIHIFIGTSEELMAYSHGKREEEVLRMIETSVSYAKGLVDNVEFSSEDALRTDKKFLVETVQTAVDCGATVINVPDTTGFATPDRYFDAFMMLRENVSGIEDVVLSAHAHNDSGRAVSCTEKAIMAGARQIEGTVLSLGERCGNADWMVVVNNLYEQDFGVDVSHIDRSKFYDVAEFVRGTIGRERMLNYPVVGEAAFTESSGIHVKGVIRNHKTYFVVNPKEVGREIEITIGQTSGVNTVAHYMRENGYGEVDRDYSKDDLERITETLKERSTTTKGRLQDFEIDKVIEEEVGGLSMEEKIKLLDISATRDNGMMTIEAEIAVDGLRYLRQAKGITLAGAYAEALRNATEKDFSLVEVRGDNRVSEAIISYEGNAYIGYGDSKLVAITNAVNQI